MHPTPSLSGGEHTGKSLFGHHQPTAVAGGGAPEGPKRSGGRAKHVDSPGAEATQRSDSTHRFSGRPFNLGVLYENGRGTKVDFAKANEWYRKASVQGDALAIGNLGMLYVRGQGVKENKTAGVALLLVSATQDASPQNNARQNIAGTRGLNTEMIAAAQTLSGELSSAENLLVPLDQYLQTAEKK
jgi:hypothetical protein